MNAIKVLTALCALLMSISSSAQEKFKVCADPLNPPYSSNKLDGFENKIAALFAEALGQAIDYTWFPQRLGFIRNTLMAPLNDNEVDSKTFKCDIVMSVPSHSDMALTTKPYYRSTYVLLIAQGRGWDDIADAAQLTTLPLSRLETLRIAMFDRSPGTTWLQKIGLLDQGIPYQSMSGDDDNNIAMQMDKDFKAKKIDMAILWGPIAAYVRSQAAPGSYTMTPMPANAGIAFDFSMSMGVRNGDTARKAALDRLIDGKAQEINAIIEHYGIPLLPVDASGVAADDDD